MSFSIADLSFVFDLIRQAAQVEILPRFGKLDASDIATKAHASDFVTVADEAAEKFIFAACAERWPHAVLVGEESVEKNKELIHAVKGAEMAIIVDPIDGTFNFANGIPAFAILFAIVEQGQTKLGVLYDPVRDDFIWALPGGGTWQGRDHLSGVQRHARAADPVRDMHGVVSWNYMEEPYRTQSCNNMHHFWGTYTYRCGGQEMRLMVTGGCHFVVYAKLTPWDHIAGVLALSEAGAHIAHFDGTPYLPGDLTGGLIIAPDAASWVEIRNTLFGAE